MAVDHLAGQLIAAEHLINIGYQELTYLQWPGTTDSLEKRIAGVHVVLERHGLSAQNLAIVKGDPRNVEFVAKLMDNSNQLRTYLTEQLILAEPVDRPSELAAEDCEHIATDAAKRIARGGLGGDLLERAYQVETPQQLAVVLGDCLSRLSEAQEPEQGDLLTLKEAAEYLRMEESGLRKLIATKAIRFIQRKRGGHIKFLREDLEAFLEENTTGPNDLENTPARIYRTAIEGQHGFN